MKEVINNNYLTDTSNYKTLKLQNYFINNN
jgi:hypothetical protein